MSNFRERLMQFMRGRYGGNDTLNKFLFSIYRDKKDRMWIGTFGGGLDLAEPTADGKYKFRHFFQQKQCGKQHL